MGPMIRTVTKGQEYMQRYVWERRPVVHLFSFFLFWGEGTNYFALVVRKLKYF